MVKKETISNAELSRLLAREIVKVEYPTSGPCAGMVVATVAPAAKVERKG
jgi:hypothetical protein